MSIERTWTKNALLMVFRPFYQTKFGGPYRPAKKFSCTPLKSYDQDASFKYPSEYIWKDDFLFKKMAKWVKIHFIVSFFTKVCIRVLLLFSNSINILNFGILETKGKNLIML